MHTISRQQVMDAARAFIGTPWRHQGRVPGRGLDCVGLITKTAHAVQSTDFDVVAYSPHSNYEAFLEHFRAEAIEIPKAQAIAADIVLIPTGGTAHCGLLAEKEGNPTLIHAYALRRRVVEEAFTEEWRARVVAAFRLPGVV